MAGKFVKFNQYLDHLQEYTGISEGEIFNGISTKDRNSALSLVKIADNLNLDAQMLYTQEVDLEALKRHYAGEKDYIPEQYRVAACSQVRSIHSMMEQFYVYDLNKYALRRLQINLDALPLFHSISYNALNDCLLFASKHFSKNDYAEIGAKNAKKFVEAGLGRLALQEKTAVKKLETFFLNSHFVEKNWDYTILKKTSSELLVRSTESDRVRSGKFHKNITNNPSTELRIGFIKELMKQSHNTSVYTVITDYDVKTSELEFRFTFSPEHTTQPSSHALH